MKLSIIIPVYFEEKSILDELAELNKKVKTPHEILVVYDTEKDPTAKVVAKYVKRYNKKNIRLVKNFTGRGKGVINAVKSGIKASRTKIVLVSMADLSDDLGKVDRMVALIDKGFDIVSASRYMKGGKQIGGPRLKGLLSRMAGISAYHLFKLPTHDPTNAFKMFRKSIFKKIIITSRGGFEYNLEVVAKAFKSGYRITEIPATWKDRKTGKSKFNLFKWLPYYIKWYLFLLKH